MGSEPHFPLAFEDDLTGLANRRYLSDVLHRRWAELCLAPPVSVVIVDLDGFKALNDEHGHLCGDDALRLCARLLRGQYRAEDVVARYGGDEFVVVAPGLEPEEAQARAERAREQVRSSPLPGAGATRPSFSIGVAAYPADGSTGPAVLHVADRRLYADKALRGGGRHHAWPALGRVAVAATALGLALLLAVALGARLRSMAAGSGVEPPPLTLAETATVERANPEEALLRAEIDDLERRIARLAAPRSERATPDGDDYRRRIAELEATVTGLRRQLEAVREPGQPRISAEMRPERAAARPSPAHAAERPAVARPTAPADGGPTAAVMMPPRLVRSVKPVYPRVARDLRRQAMVDVEVVIDEQGRVAEARAVDDPGGLGFGEAARQAAFESSFEPATRDGVPVTSTTVVRYRFAID